MTQLNCETENKIKKAFNRFDVDPTSEYAHRIRCTPPAILTLSEASIVSTIGDRKLREHVYNRELRAIRTGARVMIRTADLMKFLERRTT